MLKHYTNNRQKQSTLHTVHTTQLTAAGYGQTARHNTTKWFKFQNFQNDVTDLPRIASDIRAVINRSLTTYLAVKLTITMIVIYTLAAKRPDSRTRLCQLF